jgi:Transposase IS66 family
MTNNDSSKLIQIPVTQISIEDLVQQLSKDNIRLHQVIDEMTNTLAMQKELIQQLRDEIARLKGQKPKPNILPSKLEGQNRKPNWHARIGLHSGQKKTMLFSLWVNDTVSVNGTLLHGRFSTTASVVIQGKRSLDISRLARRVIRKTRRLGKPGQPAGTPRKKKKTLLQIHEKRVIHPITLPEGAEFKGFQRFTVQDLIFKPHNTQYQLARWRLPDGSYITGELPNDIHGHYGPELVTYILHQYHACRVPEHLLLEQLRAIGTLISAGQINNILIENKDVFFEEVAELLPAAVRAQAQVQADDTGGRHKGKNQYTTIIGNSFFSIFATTESKSRINFLKLLQGNKEEYLINEDTVEYLKRMKLPSYFPGYIAMSLGEQFTTLTGWKQFLKERNITKEGEIRFLTEAALYANAIQNGIPRNLGVHSDDAGQFDVFLHSLCWIHEERHYRKLIMTTDEAQIDLDRVRDQIWDIYQDLKTYKESPNERSYKEITEKFDEIFQQKTVSPTLNQQLKKTHEKKQELLVVLQKPETPLHNNSSETDARAAKIKLKISGGTRSDLGQKVRDTFLSLKQTCRKLSINFITFLRDRVRGLYIIPRLAVIICERALAAAVDPPPISRLDLTVLHEELRYG